MPAPALLEVLVLVLMLSNCVVVSFALVNKPLLLDLRPELVAARLLLPTGLRPVLGCRAELPHVPHLPLLVLLPMLPDTFDAC